MSLMNILRGAADQLDFVPGFDPNKDKQGLLSQILSNVGGRMGGGMNPSGTPPIVPQGSVQMPSMGQPISAPGGPMPTFSPAKINPFRKLMLGEGGVNETRAANLSKYETELANYEARQQAQAEAAKRQALTAQGVQAGLTGKDLLAYVTNPEEVSKRLAERQGIFSAGQSYQDGGQFTQAPSPYTPEKMGNGQIGAFNPNTGDLGPAQGEATPGAYRTADTAGGVIAYNEFDPADTRNLGAVPVKAPLVNLGLGGGAQSLAEIPVGQPVPESLLGGIALPDDTYAVRANNAAGFEFATIPGSATARKAESGEQAKGGRTYTLGSLIGSYSTLAKNKAITARGNSALDNAAAMYSGTGIGQTQDKLGGGVGQLANAEARDTIQGLSMKALMDMISMSDVSAKAMDSDAEMKAWLSAIKSDNYEAALTKLHVLDLSFGSGQELERAYADGTIDLGTYQYVTNRVNSDPMVKQMLDKADRYAALSNAVGQGNLTGGERQSMQDLSGLVAPDGSAVTEDDIQETMAATGMTREQIINRLRGQ